ncbi:YbaK/EbsC family protein [Paeniglutamicibacter sp. NPDC012692]|uniref:YbaK/EbsC family protein n=1 Tax=Paeniglutamicibacter sp. NPDC012692 TaxID=3364388 RepID=UPI0036AD9CA1
MNPKHQRFVADLKKAGIDREIQILDEHTHTAAAAASYLGCEVAAIANSLVFDCAGEALLIMSSGAGRVDTKVVGTALGGVSIKRATPDFVKQATGQVIGGVAPAGHPAPLRTVVDAALRDFDELWVAAGTADSLVPLSYEELIRLTGGTELVVR